MVILDNLGIHTSKGSRLLRALLAEVGEDLMLVYTPTYDPDPNRMEWLWGTLRRAVTPYPSVCQPGRPAVADRQPLGHQQRPTTGENSAMQHEFPGSI